MKKLVILPAALAALFGVAAAQSVSAEGKALGDCLIANTSAEVENSLRTVMLAALEDKIEDAEAAVVQMGLGVVTIGIQHCGVSISDIESKAFEEGSTLYGEYVGTKIITEAFAKIGL